MRVALLVGTLVFAAQAGVFAAQFGAAVAKDLPGQRFHVRPAEMPAPYATRSAGNPSSRVDRTPGMRLQAPAGYRVNLFAEGFDHARWLLAAPSGEVFLAEPRAGRVVLLVDADGDGRAERRYTFARGHDTPHGLALRGDWLYVADLDAVWRYAWKPGQRKAAGPPRRLTPKGAFGDSGGHWTRNIAISPDGRAFFVAIGSEDNLAEEPEPRATIKRFAIGGGAGKIFARGLRNPVGIAFHPDTGSLYTVVNERDAKSPDS